MIKKKRKILSIISILIFIGILVIIILQIIIIQKKQTVNQKKNTINKIENKIIVNQKNNQEKIVIKKARAIDGVLVLKDSKQGKFKVIMVENSKQSRPQSGIDKANLVIEAPVEGGITRFLAIFSGDADVSEIGPIRSARPYFIDWAKEYDGLYCHVGGSPEALNILKKEKNLDDLNQYFQSMYYWRSSKRPRPHNVYTSIKFLDKAVESLKFNTSKLNSWKFKDDLAEEDRGDDQSQVYIDYALKENEVKWIYNKEDNNYLRYQAGKKHLTKKGNEIRAKNVIIQKTKIISLDKEDRKKITTVGSGQALIFLDGKVFQGSWKKPAMTKRTRFYNQEGKEIKFNRGIIWIEIVSHKTYLNY